MNRSIRTAARSLPTVLIILVALVALTVAGCGKNYYYAGRSLPPSKLTNRVLVGIQNPSTSTKGYLQFMDAYYDIRHSYNNQIGTFSISGYGGTDMPYTIQNMPTEQYGAVYASNSGTYSLVNYATETLGSTVTGMQGTSSSIFITKDLDYVYAANQADHVLTVIERNATSGGSGTSCPVSSTTGVYCLSLPGVYRLAVNSGGTVVLAFVENSDAVYYLQRLAAGATAPSDATDCQPLNNPRYCIVPVTLASGSGKFDRPQRAVFSADGSEAYVLNCGAECGGTTSGVTALPTKNLILRREQNTVVDQIQGQTLALPGGAYNARVSGTTLYVAGQQLHSDGLFNGNLTVVNLSTFAITNTYAIADGSAGKMNFADDNGLFIGSTRCSQGERYQQAQTDTSVAFGCLTLFNTSTGAVTVDSYKGDLTGIATVTSLHKIYVAEGGQVRIYSSVDCSERDNSNVAVTGTAYEVVYMDGADDTNNTVY